MRRPAEARGGVLFVSYTGLLEPLGQSQVLAYQEALAHDRRVCILSFERASDTADADAVLALRRRVEAAGITWNPRRYHRRPPVLGTLWDVAAGIVDGIRLVRAHGLRIVHARSTVPGLMALAICRWTGARLLFDMRGFWADERVDGGLWRRGGLLYRLAKRVERRLLSRADHVVSLTAAAEREIRGLPYLAGRVPPIAVIPTCADLSRFRPADAVRTGSPPVVGYVGSAGTWYRFDAVAATFAAIVRAEPSARFVVVNRHEHELVRRELDAAGVPPASVDLRAAAHGDVPALMAAMDLGVFYYQPSYSRLACAPTKLGEFLGMGIPCLANRGVGDFAEILEDERVGVVVDEFSPQALGDGVRRLLALRSDPGVAARCVAAARRHFSLEEGVRRYAGVYAALDAAG